MSTLNKYLDNNQIKPNLNKEQLVELKEIIEKQEKSFFSNRSKECYLFEINNKLKNQ
jgi:hypothetical protein